MAAVPVFAQNTGKDSIVSTKALNDVVVSASNISRVGDQNFGKDTLQLWEVVVRATRPLAKLNSEGFVTEVKGTVLEKLGFAKDVMGMLPGVLIMVLYKFLARENLSSISMDILSAIIWKLSN